MSLRVFIKLTDRNAAELEIRCDLNRSLSRKGIELFKKGNLLLGYYLTSVVLLKKWYVKDKNER